ncbi:2-C-methyl-D-erythritol 4-phosphate cytidylyltransferase [Psychrobacter sp. I-STPA6b]|uniref:2-C-methyl-D-erythritol 4-phosphate cytidylyltransferase n=1 Tax=Psychrobacter sp. I-STPA6b TaxID=2585718 RepID=UPI001D0C0639|nr:2-C-methyl-D-erythritol 4-phosphate cytidylyltransferase [Psychrobacter sp. I-STPA6b]
MLQTESSIKQSDQTPQVHTLVVAAGKGSRFGAERPKQYTSLLGKPVLLHSLEKLSRSQFIEHVFLVIAKDDAYAQTLNYPLAVTTVYGGAERWLSVMAGVEAIWQQPDSNDADLVLIHDAARPAVMPEHIDAVIETAAQVEYGAILGVPVVDTMKQVARDSNIIQTVDRQNLWQAQTPQVFRLGVLRDMLHRMSESDGVITDEASGFERLGLPIKIVEGSRLNIKMTHPEDVKLLEAILNSEN